MSRHKYFKGWLVDALADLVRLRKELGYAKCKLQAAEKTRLKCFQQKPSGTGDKQLRGMIKYAELRYRAESERERLWQLVDKCKSCVRLQRERIVQAWQRHADRATKRYAQMPDAERHRIMREIAGLYAAFCLVDDFDTLRDSVYLSFVYDEARRLARLDAEYGSFEA